MALEKIKPFIVDGTQDFVFRNATITGNITSDNANLGNLATANFFSGTLTTGSQPNITSIGTLGNLSVTGNVSAGNIKTNNLLYANGSPWQLGGGGATVSGTNTQVQFNDASSFGSSANFTFDKTTNTLTVTNLVTNGSGITNITGTSVTGQVPNALVAATVYTNAQPNITSVGTLSSLSVTGNVTSGNATLGNIATANYFIGSGNNLSNIQGANITGEVAFAATANSVAGSNVSGAVTYASTANAVAGGNVFGQVGNSLVSGTVYTNSQPNITSVGILSNLTSNGTINFTNASNVSLGVVGNIKISGGSADYVLKTDGAGNLSWTAQSGGTGASNISNGNSNVDIPVANGNVIISAAGNANVVVVTGNGINVAGNISTSGSGGNITGANVISANAFTASANITAGNANLGNRVTANYFIGSGNNLSNIQGANVTGAVTSATTAATVTTAAQPNITSVGTLTGFASNGVVNFTNASNVSLGAVSNVKITGGSNAYVLSTDGAGNLNWVAQSGGGGGTNISNGNSNVNIPSSNGNINLTSSGNTTLVVTGTGANVTGTLTTTGNITGANVISATTFIAGTGAGGNITGANVISANTFTASANITAQYFIGNGSQLTGIASPYNDSNVANYLPTFTGNLTAGNANLGNAVSANFFVGSGAFLTSVTAVTAATVTTNAQPNITSVGTLTTLTIGNATANTTFGNGTITAAGNISFTGANVSLGDASNLKITGGTSGYFLSTDGAGNLSWGAASGGGGVSATGSNTQIQFNDNGGLGASANLTFDKSTNTFTTARVVASNGANLGNNVANIYIGGGSNNQILKTDGSGNLSWIAQPATTITVDNFTGDGSTTAFTLSTTPTNINQTAVNYNGTLQLRAAYTVSGTTLTFSEAPVSGSLIEVTTTMGVVSGAGAFVTRSYTGNGVQTTFSVTNGCTVSSVIVTENGLVQTPTVDYTIAGGTLTFNGAPADGIIINIRELAIATAPTGGGTAITVQDEGSNLTTTASLLNFVGAGVTTTNSGSNVTVTIPSGGGGGTTAAKAFGYSLIFGG